MVTIKSIILDVQNLVCTIIKGLFGYICSGNPEGKIFKLYLMAKSPRLTGGHGLTLYSKVFMPSLNVHST